MSEPQRRQVRVRRSPRIGVFLLLGAAVGVLAAIVGVELTPPDASIPTPQAIGFLALCLAPPGAVLGGAIALVLDRIAERRSRVVAAERVAPLAPVAVEHVEEPARTSEPEADPRR